VQYTSSEAPSDITICHCRTCQQLSGSGSLPFVNVRQKAFNYKSTAPTTLKLSDVAERTFCSGCGTPITMVYNFDKDDVSVTMGSIDPDSFICEPPKIKNHIFVREKAAWDVLPDDGAERWGTCEFAHLIAANKQD
jgi:hypothetical protein